MNQNTKMNKKKIVMLCIIIILIIMFSICIKQYQNSKNNEDMYLESDVEINTLGFLLVNSNINEFDYSKEEINLEIIGLEEYDVDQILYCVSKGSECTPEENLTDDVIVLDEESVNIKACIQVTFKDDSKSQVVCSDYYNIDKTKPEQGKVVLDGTLGNDGWYVSDIDINVENGIDSLSGVEMTTVDKLTITKDTNKEIITLTTRDKAGNVVEDYITIKKDATAPIIYGVTDKSYKVGDIINLSDGVTCTDNLSSKGNCKVLVNTSKIDNSKAGTYQIIYTAEDMAGNKTVKSALIKIEADEPTINFLIDETKINENGWAKDDITVVLDIKDYSNTGIKETLYCKSDKDCEPEMKITENKIKISEEGINVVCIKTTDNNNKSTTKCSEIYKLDKTAPIAGEIVVTSANPVINGWYRNNVALDVINGTDSLSGHQSTEVDITTITEDTAGDTVTLTTTDMAGNTATTTLVIKVDKTIPILTLKSSETAEVTVGDSVDIKSYFNTPTYGLSGEAIYTCSEANTSTLSVGTHSITCTVTSNSGLETVTTKVVEIITPGVIIADKIISLSGTEQGEGFIVEEEGYRYQGANPNNYIMYNDEVWRIIGLLDTTLADGVTVEPLLKLIKADSIGKYSWNQSGVDWATSDLNNILNDNYLNSTVASDSLAKCSYSTNGSCDFTTLGIKPEYRDMIQEVTWNLGYSRSSARSTALEFYNNERENSSSETPFTAKLGIMYPSDYGFAVTESDCPRTKYLYDYDLAACKNNNWLYSGVSESTITKQDGTYIYEMKSSGYIGTVTGTSSYNIRPVLYLKSDILISDSTGSITDPFIIVK